MRMCGLPAQTVIGESTEGVLRRLVDGCNRSLVLFNGNWDFYSPELSNLILKVHVQFCDPIIHLICLI